jgi:hypothetical protein
MNVNDWCEVPQSDNIKMFSINGVPWPLDEWLRLRGEMTTCQAAQLIKKWGNK